MKKSKQLFPRRDKYWKSIASITLFISLICACSNRTIIPEKDGFSELREGDAITVKTIDEQEYFVGFKEINRDSLFGTTRNFKKSEIKSVKKININRGGRIAINSGIIAASTIFVSMFIAISIYLISSSYR